MLATVPDMDDRITCGECRRLLETGHCQAARMAFIAVSVTYQPNPRTPRRCEAFVPKPSAADQRKGLERWPSLRCYLPAKRNPKGGYKR